MLSYTEANHRLCNPINKQQKKLRRNTYLIRKGNDIVVRYHETDIVTIHPNDTYTIRNGGWTTTSTKERINEYSPMNIYQRNHAWYFNERYKQILFVDGMMVDCHGDLIWSPEAPVMTSL